MSRLSFKVVSQLRVCKLILDTGKLSSLLSSRCPEMEFKEFEPRFKSVKAQVKFSAGLNLETFDTILSGTNHI